LYPFLDVYKAVTGLLHVLASRLQAAAAAPWSHVRRQKNPATKIALEKHAYTVQKPNN
jgi:hypothetical protein